MTIFGSDVSHFDSPDTRAMYADGIDFQTHKAGGDAVDAELGAWWGHMKPYGEAGGGMLLGAYWVLYPGSPATRADAFIARLDSQCPGWRDGPFILQADCEQWNNDPGTVPSKAEIKTFCDQLAHRMPELRPIVYAPKWVYGDSLSGLGYPLWASDYVTGAGGFKALYPGDSSSRWAAYSGQTPAILQYSSSATIGGQTTSDANAFRGTLAQLVRLVAPGWSDDVALTDDDKTWISAQIAAITAFDAPQSDGTPTSKIGRLAFGQGIPNGTDSGKRDLAWQVLADLGSNLVALQAKVDALAAPVAITPAELQAAVLGALRELITPAQS